MKQVRQVSVPVNRGGRFVDSPGSADDENVGRWLIRSSPMASANDPMNSSAMASTEDVLGLVRQSMQLRFTSDSLPRGESLALLQAVQQKTRRVARDLLSDDADDHANPPYGQKDEGIDHLLRVTAAPPAAFFAFHGSGQMHMPVIDWAAFRGYTMAFWLNIGSNTGPEGASQPSFQLFRFTNGSETLGVEATLQFESDELAVLTVRSCAPQTQEQKRNPFATAVVAAIAPVASGSTGSTEWRQVVRRVSVTRQRWHLLVISHSLHYVKKSKVTCYVDAKMQFSEELVYPSGLVHASKSTVGGASHVDVSIANVTMYHDELQPSMVESIFLHGPGVTLFRRWMTSPSGTSASHIVDVREATVFSPFRSQVDGAVERVAALSRLQVVFSFAATDDGTEHDPSNGFFADRSVEWIPEGSFGSRGKWISLDNLNGTSEIVQRNARLGKSVSKQLVPRRQVKSKWYRLLGVQAVPVVLDYILSAADTLLLRFAEAENVDGDERIQAELVVEDLVRDVVCVLRGLLVNNVTLVHKTLRNYILHQVQYVILHHPLSLQSAWTAHNTVGLVETVRSFATMMPRNTVDSYAPQHPTQPSVWSWNPLFASAVRSWLLNYRLWAQLSYKTQSIFNHQLYSLACEYPKSMNDLNIVSRLLETLQFYYSSDSKTKATNTLGVNQNSQAVSDGEREEHWRQQCIQTVMDTLEVCLVNQSVQVHEALEQEVLETTFARATSAVPATQGVSPATATANNPSKTEQSGAANIASTSTFAQQRRKGGVFFITLENIIWSDQPAASQEQRGHLGSEDRSTDPSRRAATSVLPHVQIRFSLLRDLRSIVRFIIASEDAAVCSALLILLRRLSTAYLDVRFGLISSNIVDCLLRNLNISKRKTSTSVSSAELTMACLPLLVYLLDWLESVEGRTVWCGLEEHLRSILNGEGTYTRGFLDLMMEFYFDPVSLSGVQQGIVMNDPTKKDSVLFPLSPVHHGASSRSFHDSGIVAMADDGLRSEVAQHDDDGAGSGGAHAAWIKLATSFCGRKLSLSWEKRVQIVRMAALRSLTSSESEGPSPRLSTDLHARLLDVYDKGVVGILHLPLKSVLPFLPVMLSRTSIDARDRVLMEISVKLKTDDAREDHQLLVTKKEWIEAFLELCVVCSSPSGRDQRGGDKVDEHMPRRAPTLSFDAQHRGEDLVVDAMVSLLCGAMQHPRGWRTFVDLITGLSIMQRKYSKHELPKDQLTTSLSSVPAVLKDRGAALHEKLQLLAHPLDWLAKVTGIVLQRMARSRTILSKVLTENVHKILVLVQEVLLSTPHQHSPVTLESKRTSGSYVWSDAQVSLLNAVLDICTRLVDSTHKTYRSGLAPGLQILQRSLCYVPSASGAALVERILVLLERAFQQEMNVASAVRVYDNLNPRDVFLSALVCLRRALLVQQGNDQSHARDHDAESEICVVLQLLILKLCTSEVFLEDLHSRNVTIHDLSELSEQAAAATLLDTLGTAINEAEMHEREEEADLVPLFPSAKELRPDSDEHGGATRKSGDLGPDPFAIAFAVAKPTPLTIPERGVDDSHTRSLWAVLEVEENRMLETLKDAVAREQSRYQRILVVVLPQRDVWTKRLYDVQEFAFRTQHARYALSPAQATALLQQYGWRIGLYEAPAPGRWRKPMDVDFPVLDLQNQIITQEIDNRRRRFSLPLEAHGLGERNASMKAIDVADDTSAVNDEAHLLLERVGRVVAEQRGGEIQDITAEGNESQPNGSSMTELEANQTQDEAGSPSKNDHEPHQSLGDDAEEFSQQGDNAEEFSQQGDDEHQPLIDRQSSSAPSSASAPIPLPSSLWYVDLERHKESGLDPGEGMALVPGEQILAQAKCRRVTPEGMIPANLYFSTKYLVFVPYNNDIGQTSEGSKRMEAADESAPGLHRCWRWKYKHITAAFLRRFRLRDSAMELFFRNGSTHFLDFPHVVKQQRNELARLLFSFLPRSVPRHWPGSRGAAASLSVVTKAWQAHQMSNYDYLMALNTFAGRSFNDLTQYPVFPWVLSDYESQDLDLENPNSYRDLSKPMGALNPERLEEYWERYHSFDDPVIPKFLYGSHYSTCAGVVLFFLVRMQPFAHLHRKMQGGNFDLPDRLFNSILETWKMCNSQMSEVKELTPEFYSDPSFLKNINNFALGKRHDHTYVKDVVLPPWAKRCPEQFIEMHRQALESDYVSQHLHEWVDLIFGFKQRGKAALKANNVFYYLTYYGVVDLDRIEDPFIRESMELQIAHFGQCPMQLFSAPHPKRYPMPKPTLPGAIAPTPTPSPAPPGTAAATVVTSPGNRSPVASAALAVSAPLTGGMPIARPLASMFQDASPSAQDKRRQWSPSIAVKPLVKSKIRWIRVFADRFLTVNELGVVELYNWKLSAKPPPAPAAGDAVDTGEPLLNPRSPEIPVQKQPLSYKSTESRKTATPASLTLSPHPSASVSDAPQPERGPVSPPAPTCPWLLEVSRDDAPFEVVPRIPVFEDDPHVGFPIASTTNGRVLITGGAPNGSIQLRLLDLDNGHVLAKASVTGHDAAVTCLSVDRLTHHLANNQHQFQSDGDELLVTGSKDATLAVWRLSRVKQDLVLFRPPRISTCPLLLLRGHKSPIIDCSLNTYLNAVVSCSETELLVHYLHDDGMVAFHLYSEDVQAKSVFSYVAASSKGFVVAVVKWFDDKLGKTSSACVVVTMAGVVVLRKEFEGENVTRLQLSTEGDLVILTIDEPCVIRLCRLDDLSVAQEYDTRGHSEAAISVASFGPEEATILVVTGYSDGSLVLHLLPDADGSVSLLGNLRRLLGVNSKLKMVKGTVQQAQNLAWTTLGNAKAVTSTARDIAGEAIGEAKTIVKGFISYLRQSS